MRKGRRGRRSKGRARNREEVAGREKEAGGRKRKREVKAGRV